ncbi:MAG: hypothetical protein ACOX0H_02970 [Patescibacteria group bacterium]|jgi:hypothetical protein
MNFIWVIIIAIIVYKLTMYNFFSWKTIVIKLWKNILKQMDYLVEMDNTIDTGKLEKSIKIQGNVINAILKYVNYYKAQNEGKEEHDDDFEEETFGYNHFDFNQIMLLANLRKEEKNQENQKGQS